jgi:hypothetical protein
MRESRGCSRVKSESWLQAGSTDETASVVPVDVVAEGVTIANRRCALHDDRLEQGAADGAPRCLRSGHLAHDRAG